MPPATTSQQDPKTDGILKTPSVQFSWGAEGTRKGNFCLGYSYSNWEACSAHSYMPPSKCPKPKARKVSPAPAHSSSPPLISNLQRPERAMANRNTYSRAVHLAPPPPVSRPPGRPYGSKNKDSILEKFSGTSRKDESDGLLKEITSSNSSTTTSTTSAALSQNSSRLMTTSTSDSTDNSTTNGFEISVSSWALPISFFLHGFSFITTTTTILLFFILLLRKNRKYRLSHGFVRLTSLTA